LVMEVLVLMAVFISGGFRRPRYILFENQGYLSLTDKGY
jgi:hypothetical protein